LPQVVELCRRCGFEIPADDAVCPGCRRDEEPPSLVSRLLAGEALPSRSVHPLRGIRPRRERAAIKETSSRAGRSVLDVAVLLMILALFGVASGLTVRMDGFVVGLPDGAIRRIDSLTVVAAWASAVALGLGLLTLAAGLLRRAGRGIARRGRDALS
jgi:hypothetical protein